MVFQASLLLPETRKTWAESPYPARSNVYLWNVTNPEEVSNGAKPILKQVGPYHVLKFNKKFNLVDNDIEDTVEYEFTVSYMFRPEFSFGLTGQEVITIPNLLALVSCKNFFGGFFLFNNFFKRVR